jgi:hypothetical protein
LSESNLGWADVGLMGYEENLHASRAIAACVDIPLSADGDTGYGNAINVFFTVRGFEAAGVDGLMLEDQVWPKRKEVISAEEGVEKIRAAVEARRDPDFIIKARTDAMATHGVKEAIRRLNLYAEVGADLLFADALLSRDDIALVAREVSKPLSVNMGLGIRASDNASVVPQGIAGHRGRRRQLSSPGDGGGDPGHAQRANRVAAIGPGRPRDRTAGAGGVVRRNQRPDGVGHHQADGAALPDSAATGGEVWESGWVGRNSAVHSAAAVWG